MINVTLVKLRNVTITVKVEKNGKLLLPVNVRRILKIRDGETDLVVRVDEERRSLTVETREDALVRARARVAQYVPAGTMLSEELMADRREESANE
jgi:bifunctional DNA-binding transcriptional regulator/antitoxin component of YhaV-PrlF toxin-antitoxin module